MKNMKSTKRSLFLSAMALLLCTSMLIGTTYAWFTESVSSVNNIITGGNLDVELEWWNATDKEWQPVTKDTNVFMEDTYWEPGHTEVVYLKVSNKGDLSLKYQLGVNVADEVHGTNVDGKDFLLSEKIYFDAIETATEVKYENRAEALAAVQVETQIKEGYSTASKLYPVVDNPKAGEPSEEYVTLVVYMPETVGNEANHNGIQVPSITLGINLIASQFTWENDSFDENYDKDAGYNYGKTNIGPYHLNVLPNGVASYDEATKTYTITVDTVAQGGWNAGQKAYYAGYTVRVGGYKEGATVKFTKLDGTEVTWKLADEERDGFITNGVHQQWTAVGKSSTYYYDIDGDGVTDFAVKNDASKAGVEVKDLDELKLTVFERKAPIVALTADLAIDETITIPADTNVTLNLNGKTIASTSSATDANSYAIDVHGTLNMYGGTVTTKHVGADMAWNNCTGVFHMDFNGKLNLDNVTVENLGGTAMAYGIDITNVYAANDSKLTVTNSTIKSTYIAVRVFNNGDGKHNVEINDSKLQGKYAFWVQYYDETDSGMGANTAAKRANLNIDIYNNGNTFVGAEGKVSPIFYGFNEYTYFDATGAIVKSASSQDELNNALTGNVSVNLADGNYTMPSVSNGDVTISGTKGTVITVGKPNLSGTDVTFNGVTVKGSGYATGVQHVDTVTYNDVTIVGEMCLYGEKVVFNNCTFELAKGQYIWTYGAAEVEFNNCTFNTAGKAILVYNEGAGADTKVTVDSCTFNATAGDKAGAIANQNCAAIEIDSTHGDSFTLVTNGNNVDSDFSGLWRIKSINTKVTVNGTEYTQIAVDGKLMTIDGTNVTVQG